MMKIQKFVIIASLAAGFAFVSATPSEALKFKPGKAFKSVTRSVGKVAKGGARTVGKVAKGGARVVGKGAKTVGKAYVGVVKTGAKYSYRVGKQAALAPGRNIQMGYRAIRNGPKTVPGSLRRTYGPPRLR